MVLSSVSQFDQLSVVWHPPRLLRRIVSEKGHSLPVALQAHLP